MTHCKFDLAHGLSVLDNLMNKMSLERTPWAMSSALTLLET